MSETLQSLLPPADARKTALYACLSAHGVPWTTHAHAAVFTVGEAQQLRGTVAGTNTKNLFLEDRKGGLWLITVPEDLSVD